MPRRTKEEAAATREGLLDAAEACFLQYGVFRATLDEIAARAGYTKGAAYWHFRDKYEVLQAVMQRVELPVYSELEKLAADAGEWPLRAILTFYRKALERFGSDIHFRNAIEIHLLHCELVEETRPVYERMQRAADVARAREVEALRRAQRLGHLRAGLDAETCARVIGYTVHGALREWVLDPESVRIQREGLAAVEAVLWGFAADRSVLDGIDTKTKAPARRVRHRSR